MIEITVKGDYSKTLKFLNNISRGDIFSDLAKYGQMGIDALEEATPVDSNLSANRWAYRIVKNRLGPTIEWFNTNVTDGDTPIVILVQYGHATRDGGYIVGRDFINPAMRPIFDKIANDVWKKVKS